MAVKGLHPLSVERRLRGNVLGISLYIKMLLRVKGFKDDIIQEINAGFPNMLLEYTKDGDLKSIRLNVKCVKSFIEGGDWDKFVLNYEYFGIAAEVNVLNGEDIALCDFSHSGVVIFNGLAAYKNIEGISETVKLTCENLSEKINGGRDLNAISFNERQFQSYKKLI